MLQEVNLDQITQSNIEVDASIHEDHELRVQVSQDLKEKISQFRDPKKGIKILASQMGIHEKTLKRLIECQNKPGYQTLLKIYRVLFQTQKDNEILERSPAIVKMFLMGHQPKPYESQVTYSLDVEKELNRDPVFAEIYLLAATGGVTREFIIFQFGQYGDRLLQKMIDQKVLINQDKYKFVLGPNQATLGPDTLKHLGQLCIEHYLKPENGDLSGENFHAFFAESLNEEAYNEWLKIDEEAFKKKIQLANRPGSQGHRRVFTFIATDTISRSKNEIKH